MTQSGKITVGADVINTGARAGEEVIQLYIRDLVASVARPIRELKGFQRMALTAGERRHVSFTLRAEDLVFAGPEMKMVAEPGQFKVWIGPNCLNGLEGSFTLV